ncbi:Uncharacterised protein [Clostridioides difficile]|nr:Uncharacterised protein [Clostridioides difficile]
MFTISNKKEILLKVLISLFLLKIKALINISVFYSTIV